MKKPQTNLTYIPFDELVKGNHFVMHEKHHYNTDPSTVFVKINRNLYMNTETEFRVRIDDHNLFRTWVAPVAW